MTNETLEAYYRLVAETGDLIRDGFRRERTVPQNLQVPGTALPRTESSESLSGAFQEALAQRRGAGTGARTGRAEGPGNPDSVHRERADAASAEASGNLGTLFRRIEDEVHACRKCPLSMGRIHAVPGEGTHTPVIMIIGEGPGAEEDRTGRPFVGPAGQYLDKWIEAIGLTREKNCFIANIVKCRPPNNRDPQPDEAEACIPYLDRQIDLLKPRAILTVGRIAIQNLLNTTQGIGALRGQTYRYRDIPVIPTYHPSGVLRNPDYRKPVWEDLRRLKQLLDASPGGAE